MTNKLPVTSIKILGTKIGLKYKTVLKNDDGDDLDGCYEHHSRDITLQPNHSPDELYSTLLHEAAHAWLHLSGLHAGVFNEDLSKEEMVVSSFEMNFLPVIRALIHAQDGTPLSKKDKQHVNLSRRRNDTTEGPGTDRPTPDPAT